MARCASCAGDTGDSTVFTQDSFCIEMVGDGSALDPLIAAPRLDPAGGLTCGVAGLAASGGGGGGVPDEHILIASNFISQSLDSGTPFPVPLDSANVLGVYVQRGTDITWSAANPTRLTINTTGVYDIAAGPAFSATSASLPVTVFAEIYVNGSTDVRSIVFSSQLLLNNVGALHVQNNSGNGWAFTAGQYLELVVGASDAVAGPDAAVLLYAAISVTRRV